MAAAQNPEIRKAVNTLYELSADEKTRAEYEYRLKARRDAKWIVEETIELARDDGLQKGRQEGLQKGLQEGLQKGRQEGLQNGRQEILNLLKSGTTLDEIMSRFNK